MWNCTVKCNNTGHILAASDTNTVIYTLLLGYSARRSGGRGLTSTCLAFLLANHHSLHWSVTSVDSPTRERQRFTASKEHTSRTRRLWDAV